MPYPTSLTTGVPEGVTLTSSGDVVVTKAGAVVEGLDIRGTVIIQADNVTIKNCNIKFSGDFGVYVDAGGASVINCDIDGQGTAKPGSMGIAGSGTFINNDIRGVENGIAVWWGGTTVRGNYIHDLKGPGSDPHYDGIQIMGGNIDGVLVEGNTILTRDTSAIFCDNMAGSLSNITIRQNYLDGPCSFPLYFDGAKSSYPMKNIVWEENYIGKGVYGFEYITPDSYGNTPSRSGNIYTDNPLPPGQAPLLGATTPTSPQTPVPAPTPTEPAPAPEGVITKIGTGSDTLILKITQDAYQGDANYSVFIDGKQIGGTFIAKALHGSGQVDTLEIKGDWTVGSHNVSVKLLNDLWGGTSAADRNVYVESATYNGATVNGSSLSIEDATPKSFTISDSTAVQNPATPTPNVITGTSGADSITGTAAADTMKGLEGNDTYVVNHAGDIVIEASGGGTDTVQSSVTMTLAENVENLKQTGTGAIDATGNSLNNFLDGNDSANVLKGGGGDDLLNGRYGADTLWGNAGRDTFQFTDKYSANGDKVMDFVHGTDKLDFAKIDANGSVQGTQAFIFDGYVTGGKDGHIWAVEDQASKVTHLYVKVDGFVTHIDLTGSQLGLTASDFYL
jgi:hypothetical protein